MQLVFFGFISIIALEYLRFIAPAVSAKGALVLSLLFGVYAFAKHGSEFFRYPQVKALTAFVCLTAFAVLHGLISSYALQALQAEVGYLILAAVGFAALRTQRTLNLFAVAFVLVHCVLVLYNLDKYWQAERVGGYHASYFSGDGNDFGWMLIIAVPMALYLFSLSRNLLLRGMAGGGFLLLVLGILGTQSRGASLALAVALFYFWLVVSRRKAAGFAVLGVLFVGVLALAPAHYLNRMETIANYEQDSSAMGRIHAWTRATEMALDHPLLGVGAGSFNSAYGRFYREAGDPTRWMSTHSVYFKVFAEYGFPGLLLFLYVIYRTWRGNRALRRHILANRERTTVPAYLPELVNTSVVGYAAAGAFLTGVDYPHLYVLLALSLGLDHVVRSQVAARPATVEAPSTTRSPVFTGEWHLGRSR